MRLRLEHLDEVVGVIGPLMDGFAAPWCVAGGWGLDHFLGRVSRPHDDLELALFRHDQAMLHAHLRGWTFEKIVDGRREPWLSGDWLSLPVHEIHARSDHRPPRAMEFLLNERDGDTWSFRRNPAIKLPIDRAIVRSDCGLPVLAPEIVMLFKAKSPRAKDEADFRAAHAVMGRPRQRWLRDALQTCHPGHPWIGPLDAAVGHEA